MMKLKAVLGIVLLAFAAASLVVLAARELHPRTGSVRAAGSAAVTVYYFHGSQRCASCEMFEAYARRAVEDGFAQELKSGSVVFASENFELPANRALRDKYKPAFPTVVVVRRSGAFRKLDELQALLADQRAFALRVQGEIAAGLKESP